VIGTSFGVGGAANGAVLIGDARETIRGALFVDGLRSTANHLST
jgi:hypothetical protein